MYCPNCGGLVNNGRCSECKKEIDRNLLGLEAEKVVVISDRNACLMAYLFFPLSMFMRIENKKLVKFHQNQGLTLFIVELLTGASYFIPTIGKFVGFALSILTLFLVYTGIKGVLQAEEKKLPIIGDYTFIK